MDAKTLKKLADQFDELSATIIAIGGTFRAAAGAGAAAGGDGKAGGKPAATAKNGKGKPAKEEAAEEELTIDTVREKLRELVDAKGKEKMVEALEAVGAGKLADVDESQYQELLDAAQEMIDAEDEPEPEEKPAKGKKPAKKKAKEAVDLDTVKERAADIDKATLVAILKKFKAKNLSALDEDQYEDFIAACDEAEEDPTA